MKTLNKRNKHIDRSVIKEIVLSIREERGANLRGVDLRGANLRGVDLRDADLRDADLCVADLCDANLGGANLGGVKLDGAKNIYIFNAFDTSQRMVYCIKHPDTWYVKTGCFWGTLAELKAKVLATHKSEVYLHNIALLEKT